MFKKVPLRGQHSPVPKSIYQFSDLPVIVYSHDVHITHAMICYFNTGDNRSVELVATEIMFSELDDLKKSRN